MLKIGSTICSSRFLLVHLFTDNKQKFRFQWDQNKDGYISIEELKSLVAENENITLSKRSLDILYARFDRDHNNQLDFNEFLEMINHPRFKQIFKRVTSK